MTLVIGVDEAGYGPNLGPLAIGLSAWDVNQQPDSEPRPSGSDPPAGGADLYQALEPFVTSVPDGDRIAIADSKALYKPGGGVELLERGVLAMLSACMDQVPRCLDTLIDLLTADGDGLRHELPWHAEGFAPDVPAASEPDDLHTAITIARTASEVARLTMLRGRLVFPAEFNAACDAYGSKGLALSHWTLSLLRSAIDELRGGPPSDDRGSDCGDSDRCDSGVCDSEVGESYVRVTCDKHGGRNNYAGLLAEHFPEYRLRVVVESRPRSAYRLNDGQTELRIEFRTKGESQLEAALASMVAKYLRELSMAALNAYWRSHLPNLKPTAGYPMDAKRFKADIAAKQRELGIEDDRLWRCR